MSSSSSSSTVMSNSSSSAITSSARSRLSASRSSAKLASFVTLSASTARTCTARAWNRSKVSLTWVSPWVSRSQIERLEAHAEAAVDGDDGTGDVGGGIGREEGDRGGHLVDGADAPDGDLGAEGGALVVGHGVEHVGGDRPRRHHVGGDAARPVLAGDRPGEPDEARL